MLLPLLTAFSLKAQAPAPPVMNVLHSFSSASGSFPASVLISNGNGGLYGTASSGGAAGQGVVFKLAPPQAGSRWTYLVLYSFLGSGDGSHPGNGLIFDAGGNIFGVTAYGGEKGAGTVFELKPPVPGSTAWTETVVYSFTGGADGANPLAPLVLGSDGSLYGTAAGGLSGRGVAFMLQPPTTAGSSWKYTLLHNFEGGADGAVPAGSLVFGRRGRLYGFTNAGGASNLGTVFELIPPQGAGGWTEAVIYSFHGGTDGSGPLGAPVFDGYSNLYGNTVGGGASGMGTVFQLKVPATSGAGWTEFVRYSFRGGADGANPSGAMIFGTNGVLYGTTLFGGPANAGTVFQLGTPASPQGGWVESVLQTFSGANGARPQAGVVFGSGGTLYGTTLLGGSSQSGTLFKLIL
ncbi:MAG: choice-of-anchor tandem repeat GloVer-containing protein [Bryobacteraceae bacterium]